MNDTTYDVVITNATVATMQPNRTPYGLIEQASIGITNGQITYVGPDEILSPAGRSYDAHRHLITPALIDCHTHVVFGGDRISEFEQRLGGVSYADIAANGGGIAATVRATRAASDQDLLASASRRLRWLLASGVGTVEIKSGYGLNQSGELRMLRVARALEPVTGMRVRTSLLAAHAIPPEHRNDPDRYIKEICDLIIPDAASQGLADSVDAFCEHIAFSPDQVRRVFDSATAHGLPVRLHADQLSDQGGAALAAEYGALSADHLEHAARDGIEAMAAAGTVAVLVPGASVFLDESARPDVHAMRESGVRMAVSTDINPGTSPVASLQSAMWLAAARFRLTPEETLAGTTRHAAAALGLADSGVIEAGMRADLTVWDTQDPATLSYWTGANLCKSVWMGGETVYDRGDS